MMPQFYPHKAFYMKPIFNLDPMQVKLGKTDTPKSN